MATEQELLIKINTLANTVGLEKAASGLEKMAVAAQSTGNTTAKVGKQVAQVGQQAAQAGEQGAGGMNVMSAATAALNGNFAGTASAIVPLITKVQALKTALTSISLVAAGITVLYTAFSKISEYAAKAAETVAAFNIKSRQDMIDAVTNAYKRQAIALERISTIRDAELERQKAENEANKEFELASSRQQKMKELQGTTDDSKRAQIEAKYARIEQQITGQYDSKSDEAEFDRMKKREEELRKAAENNAKDISQKQALLRSAQKDAGAAESKTEALKEIKPTSLVAWGMSRRMIEVKEAEAEKARAQEKSLLVEIDALEKARDDITDEINRNVGLRPSTQKRMQASSLGRQNETAAMDIADSDRKMGEQEALYKSWEKMAPLYEQLHPTDQAELSRQMQQYHETGILTAGTVDRMYDDLTRKIQAIDDKLNRDRNR
jgi:hypothetical protein